MKSSLFPPVEPRSIVGTGMSQDPEAIDALEHEWAERDRANQKPPKKKFKQVFKEKLEEKERDVLRSLSRS
jgi:hypothetical protein